MGPPTASDTSLNFIKLRRFCLGLPICEIKNVSCMSPPRDNFVAFYYDLIPQSPILKYFALHSAHGWYG